MPDPPCHVCDRPVGAGKCQVTPERNPSLSPVDDARVYVWCPLCLDAFLALLPLSPSHLYLREATGVWRTTRRSNPTRGSVTKRHIAPVHEGHVLSPE